jgi:hypothetical protein
MAYESTPIIPTEPIPIEPGTPITYEQGERLLQLLTDQQGINTEKVDKITQLLNDHQGINVEKLDQINQLLTDIKTNTVPVVTDHVSNPSGIAMTYEQGQAILNFLDVFQEIALYGGLAVLLIIVSKFLYRLIGGTFFGGL